MSSEAKRRLASLEAALLKPAGTFAPGAVWSAYAAIPFALLAAIKKKSPKSGARLEKWRLVEPAVWENSNNRRKARGLLRVARPLPPRASLGLMVERFTDLTRPPAAHPVDPPGNMKARVASATVDITIEDADADADFDIIRPLSELSLDAALLVGADDFYAAYARAAGVIRPPSLVETARDTLANVDGTTLAIAGGTLAAMALIQNREQIGAGVGGGLQWGADTAMSVGSGVGGGLQWGADTAVSAASGGVGMAGDVIAGSVAIGGDVLAGSGNILMGGATIGRDVIAGTGDALVGSVKLGAYSAAGIGNVLVPGAAAARDSIANAADTAWNSMWEPSDATQKALENMTQRDIDISKGIISTSKAGMDRVIAARDSTVNAATTAWETGSDVLDGTVAGYTGLGAAIKANVAQQDSVYDKAGNVWNSAVAAMPSEADIASARNSVYDKAGSALKGGTAASNALLSGATGAVVASIPAAQRTAKFFDGTLQTAADSVYSGFWPATPAGPDATNYDPIRTRGPVFSSNIDGDNDANPATDTTPTDGLWAGAARSDTSFANATIDGQTAGSDIARAMETDLSYLDVIEPPRRDTDRFSAFIGARTLPPLSPRTPSTSIVDHPRTAFDNTTMTAAPPAANAGTALETNTLATDGGRSYWGDRIPDLGFTDAVSGFARWQ